jgi:hypothetical protein
VFAFSRGKVFKTLWEKKHKAYSETDMFKVIDFLIDVIHLLRLVDIFFNNVNKLILSRDAKIKFYTTFIRPVFEYCCELWNGCRAELTERLEHPQLAIDRIVTGLPS